MQSDIMIAFQVFATGFVISLFIAILIKATLFGIRFFSNKNTKKPE